MNRIKIPSVLKKMNCIFEGAGFQAYLVGGAVRDMMMQKPAADWDVATDAAPRQVMALFRRVIPTGIAHGTVTVHFMGKEVEVTTFRTERGYSDGRRPDSVAYAATIGEDLSRRDFTMNAVAAALSDGAVVDPFGGRVDIQRKVIRTVGSPLERFSEDGLRPVRAIRFAAQLGFEIERETAAAIADEAVLKVTAGISAERFRDELMKMLAAEKPSAALRLMERTGILRLFLPELADCRGCVQSDGRGFHDFDVLDHLFYACDGAPKEKPSVRLAALLHDIGKPAARAVKQAPDGGELYTFYNHERISAQMAERLLSRLRFPNSTTASVCHLVENHMFHYEHGWSDAAVRRFLARVGADCVGDLFDLRLADMYGMHGTPVRLHDSAACALLLELKDRIEGVLRQNAALDVKSLAVNGTDLMQAGIPAGRQLGGILRELLEAVLEDPAQNEREALLEMAKRIYARG